jgi:hypothetical protein
LLVIAYHIFSQAKELEAVRIRVQQEAEEQRVKLAEQDVVAQSKAVNEEVRPEPNKALANTRSAYKASLVTR